MLQTFHVSVYLLVLGAANIFFVFVVVFCNDGRGATHKQSLRRPFSNWAKSIFALLTLVERRAKLYVRDQRTLNAMPSAQCVSCLKKFSTFNNIDYQARSNN